MQPSPLATLTESIVTIPFPGLRESTPVQLGLIGVGGFGQTHLRYISQFEEGDKVHLLAVADPASASLAEAKASLEAKGVHWYGDYRQMFTAEPSLEAVQISTPIPFHEEMVRDALARGYHVNLEKPPVVLIQQLESLIALDHQQRVAVGFQHIDSIQIQTLKQWIMAGRLGTVTDIRIGASWPRRDDYYRRAPWAGKMMFQGRPVFDGPATNAMAHLLHNAMYLAGTDHDHFAAPFRMQGEFYRARPMESYDTACLRGWFPGGATFIAAMTHATEELQPYRIEVRGTRDWARISDDGQTLETSSGIHSFPPEETDAFVRAHGTFLSFVRRGSRPRTRLIDARGFVLALNGALVSSERIHSIDDAFVRRYRRENEFGYDIIGLNALIDRSFREGLLFSEMDAPWARASKPVAIDLHHQLKLEDYRS